MKKIFIVVLLFGFVFPSLVLAAPLTGANSNVGVYYNSESALDDTNDANDADEAGDVSWVNAGGNYSYIGYTNSKFNKVYLDIETESALAAGMDYDLNIEYYNGNSWVLLTTIAGNQNPFRSAGVKNFSFTPPADWAETTPEMSESIPSAYFIRIGDGSQGASLNQISIFRVDVGGESVPEFNTYLYILCLALGGWFLTLQVKKYQLHS